MSLQQLATNIKYIRTRKGLTQMQVSEIVGYLDTNVCGKWEGKVTIPNTNQLLKLSQLFGTTIDQLVRKDLSKN